jgi:hypothetical protein
LEPHPLIGRALDLQGDGPIEVHGSHVAPFQVRWNSEPSVPRAATSMRSVAVDAASGADASPPP